MMNRNEFFPSFPVDVRALWDINGKSVDYAEKAYRAWLEAAGEMQAQAIAFFNERLARDSEAVTRLGRCKSPAEVLTVQAEYAGHVFADFVNESQRIAASLGKIARAGALAEPAYESREASTKRPAHRPAAH
ncbi:MAG TPA: phasin family protein [Casimicrobiaceae bacterium]|nr:phasin family protein [Casimicrobiaceae bacterium]